MNKNYLKPVFTLMLCLCTLPLLRGQNPNPNLDFSYGNLSNWKCYKVEYAVAPPKTYYDSLSWVYFANPDIGSHAITANLYGNTDQNTCNELPYRPEGYPFSARVGWFSYRRAASMRYTLSVDSSNYYLKIPHAFVCEGTKNRKEEFGPRFGVRFQDTTGKLLPVGVKEISVADSARMSYCKEKGGYWTDWEVWGFSLKPWIGQRVVMVIYAMGSSDNLNLGYGYVACASGTPEPWLNWCSCSQTAVFEAPEGYVSYLWKDGGGNVLDTVRRFTSVLSLPDSHCICIMRDALGVADTQRVSVRQTSLQASMTLLRDSLSPYIHLANTSVVTGESRWEQSWRISRADGSGEFVTTDSAFGHYFRDTGLYRVLLTVRTRNGCEDTCSRLLHVPKIPIELLSVRPDADSLEGKNVTYPRVLLCNNVRKYLKDAILRVYVLDSAGKTIRQMSDTIPSNSSGDTVEMLFKSFTYSVPDYTGIYRLKAVCEFDTVTFDAHCFKRPDTLDVRLLSIFPKADTSEGGTDMPSYMKLQYYANFIPIPSCRVNVCVQVLDSGFVLLNQSMHGINLVNNIEVTSAGSHKVPDYTGCYYLKAFFTNLKDSFNKVTSNDTAFFKAYCFKHLKTDVQLVSVRPQHDSAEVGTWTSPVVVVKNVGDLDVRNVAVKVQVDTCTSSSYMGDMFAYYWDTIPFLAAGDSVKWVLSARYQVREVWTCSYYRMYASVAVDSDEVNANNNASYDANCYKSVDFRLISFHIPSDTLWGGVPVCPKVRIVNNSVVKVKGFKFRMEVSDSAGTVLQSWEESGADYLGTDYVKAGDTVDFQCMQPVRVPNYNGVFRLRAAVSYLYKEYRLLRRDTLEQYYRCFHLDTINVALTDLLYPVTSEALFGRTKVHPSVMVWNRSNVKLDSLGITALVYDNVGALYDSITEVLPRLGIGVSLPYTFTSCYRVPNAPGKYTLRVRLEVPEGEVSPKDNEIQNQFRSRVRPDTIDVAVTELLYPVAMEALTGHTEVKPQVRVWNRSNLELEDLELTALVYDSAGALLDSLSGVIPEIGVDSQTVFQFSAAYRVPNADGKYTLLVRLKAPEGDTCPANNEIRRLLLSKRNHAVDLQLLAVSLSDTGVLKGGSWVRPKVRVANPLPNRDAMHVRVYLEVQDSTGQSLALLREEIARIPMSDTVEQAFADTFQVPNYTGRFWLKAYLQADSSETDCSNDTLTAEFRCQSTDAVREVLKSNWQLGQNIPNPAADKTLVPVTLPMPGTVRLQVFAADGRLLYRSEHAVAEGKSLLPLDLAGSAAGVYYYSVEYRGERQVRKMVVE